MPPRGVSLYLCASLFIFSDRATSCVFDDVLWEDAVVWFLRVRVCGMWRGMLR